MSHDTKNCIVTEAVGLAGRAEHWAALARRRGRWGAQARVLGRWGVQQALRCAAGRWARGRAAGARGAWQAGAGRAASRRWACGARAAWARGLALGCALGALDLFSIRFDSVLFLSRFLNVVREPGS